MKNKKEAYMLIGVKKYTQKSKVRGDSYLIL